MVSADEVSRSLRGTAAFLTRRPEGLAQFSADERAVWRSLLSVLLTVPALVVELGTLRLGLGRGFAGLELLSDPGLALACGAAHLAGFLLVPVLTVAAARRRPGAAAFLVVTNWIASLGALLLALPGALLLSGLATPALASLFSCAFAVVVLQVRWYGTRITLGTDGPTAAIVALGGFLLQSAPLGLLGAWLPSP